MGAQDRSSDLLREESKHSTNVHKSSHKEEKETRDTSEASRYGLGHASQIVAAPRHDNRGEQEEVGAIKQKKSNKDDDSPRKEDKKEKKDERSKKEKKDERSNKEEKQTRDTSAASRYGLGDASQIVAAPRHDNRGEQEEVGAIKQKKSNKDDDSPRKE